MVVIGTLDGVPSSPRLEITGPYEREHLADLIETHRINLMLFPSICPESFSYVVEELIRLALPIVAFDLGAPGERLRSYDKARLCDAVSAEAALATLDNYHRQLAARPIPVEDAR